MVKMMKKSKWSSKKKAVMQLVNYYEFKGDFDKAESIKSRYSEVLNEQ